MDIVPVVKSQFYAALEMLKQVIGKCPAELWLAGEAPAVFPDEGSDQAASGVGRPSYFWQVAYHALFYAHLYLQPAESDFVPWPKHRTNVHFLSLSETVAAALPGALEPYTQAELMEYAEFCQQQLNDVLPRLDFDGPSGFPWLPFTKLELQFYSLRHLQGHAGELSERLLANAGIEIDWIGRKR
jgi:hypothetical protein